jgi:bifunctional non-homologous end joining protein LigD
VSRKVAPVRNARPKRKNGAPRGRTNARKKAKTARKLSEYRRKRHFERTPEPAGGSVTVTVRTFVIHKHFATRLHYDLRLELDGTLKSWAVPKGPSLDPADKRLAVQVEDHPIEYATFEGIIPEGEYGAGPVMVWDHGTWEPTGSGPEDLAHGKLKFTLHGQKLRGGWTLVRMGGRAGAGDKNWLLIKERDAEARPAAEYDVTVEEPLSAASGRTMGEIRGVAAGDVHEKEGKTKGSPKTAASKPKAAP